MSDFTLDELVQAKMNEMKATITKLQSRNEDLQEQLRKSEKSRTKLREQLTFHFKVFQRLGAAINEDSYLFDPRPESETPHYWDESPY
jgi:flagellar capping protein FliD